MNTLAEVAASWKEVLTPEDVAPLLRVRPHSIRLAARKDPKGLGFPVIVMGSRTLIPRKSFLAFMAGE